MEWIRVYAAVAVGMMLCSTVAEADDFSFYVHEGALNAVAEEIGPQAFSGTETVQAPDYPCIQCKRFAFGVCVEPVTTMCDGPVVASGTWQATVDDVKFSVRPDGVRFTGTLQATFAGFTYEAVVRGDAHVELDDDAIRLKIDTVSVPLSFHLPLIGTTTVTTLSVSLPYEASFPIEGRMRLESQEGRSLLQLEAYELSRTYELGRIRIQGDVHVW